jgi:similar to stage IV sporulation protein
LLAQIWGWLLGYVKIRITKGAEPLLNLALQSGIDVYDVIWYPNGTVEAKLYYKQLGELRHLAHKSKSSFRIVYGKGFHFSLKYMKKRIMLPVGIFIFVAGLYILSGFVFFVGVESKEELVVLKEQEIKLVAQDYGIYAGARIKEADFTAMEKAIKKALPNLAWINITRQGTMIHINVAEKTVLAPEDKTKSQGSILAAKDGLIEEILIMHGEPKVKEGDTVSKGQVLVEPLEDGIADAIIKARVWYYGFGECLTKEEITQNSGKIINEYYLSSPDNDKKILLWADKKAQTGDNYKINLVDTSVQGLYLWRNIPLPVEITKLSYQPTYTFYREISEEEAKLEALERAAAAVKKSIPINAEITKETQKLLTSDGGIYQVQVIWECIEEIGIRK